MTRRIGAIVLFALTLTITSRSQVISFDKDEVGKSPSGFTTALTGKGTPGSWVVQRDDSAPSKPNVLAQTDMDNTDYRFPVCIYDEITAKDVDLSVAFKPLKGSGDQGAGLVWRYKDKNNYYVVRANALEDNVVLYKVEKGRRTDLPVLGKGRTYGQKVKVPSGVWGVLRVIAKGKRFHVLFGEKKLFEVEDSTFSESGKVGVWTKADSYILFDDLKIAVLDK